jgi:hypothetical protein
MEQAMDTETRKVRTALILASIALAFFVGVVVRFWLW